jgi:hypothetical protein
VLPSERRALGAPESHRANQAPPLMPAQAEKTEQAARHRRGLRNDRASQLDIVELSVWKVAACSRSTGEEESKREVWSVVSGGRDGETFDCSLIDHQRGRAESGPRATSVDAVLNRYVSETAGAGLDREAQCHVLIEACRRENIEVEMAVVIIGDVDEFHIQIWS